MIDFPANPTVGQVFVSGGIAWTWDGTKWEASGIAAGQFLPLSGGTLTGNLAGTTAAFSGLARAASPPAADNSLDLATTSWAQANVKYGDNRIINGDMRIDQRNNGATFNGQNSYLVDRWYCGAPPASNKFLWGRNLNSINGPTGFPYYLGAQSTSAYTALATEVFYLEQRIEADMASDFAWGTLNAQSVTLSFWAYSSLTGTFSGSFLNLPTPTRSYPFTFSIPTANTWTKIVLTIPGDTGGPWIMSGNAGSVRVAFDYGNGANFRGPAGAWAPTSYFGATGAVSIVGTNAATFYVTGVKLEIGSVATPYNRQSLAKSMADCQRYFRLIAGSTRFTAYTAAQWSDATLSFQTMRAAPTAVVFNAGAQNNLAAGSPTIYVDNQSGRMEISSGPATNTVNGTDTFALIVYYSLDAEL